MGRAILGTTTLAFCSLLLAIGVYGLRLTPAELPTFAAAILLGVALATVIFAFLLDAVKAAAFAKLGL